MNQTQKWIAGVVGVLAAALVSGGIAWAQDTQGDLERLDERTRGIEEMRRDVAAIQRDVARICGHLGIDE